MGTSDCPFNALMVGGARSATHFIVSPSTYQPPHGHTHTHTNCTNDYTQETHGNKHTHTWRKITSTQTQIDIEAGVSPQGVNINICPCHTHKGEGCRLVRPHVPHHQMEWRESSASHFGLCLSWRVLLHHRYF